MAASNDRMEKLVSLCKRRGFAFPTAEQYGGLQGFWDWGPLGVELKNNIKRQWWKRFVQMRGDVVGLDSAIITSPIVWEKSGHVKGFSDPLIECRACNRRFKPAEYDITDIVPGTHCPYCNSENITKSRDFNLMFKTFVGPVEDSGAIAFLRPETAQNIFVNYENVLQMSRMKIPFGIAQIGKAFRNEITPGNFIFRTREFEQMELEFFTDPSEDEKWFRYWVDESLKWFTDFGIKSDHLRKYEQKKDELAHYAKATVDIQYNWPFSTSNGEKGWAELMGIANRTDFDLKAHGLSAMGGSASGGKGDAPFVIEPSFGVERAALAFLLDAYEEIAGGRTTTTESTKEREVVLRLNKHLAPVKVAVLPLSKKGGLSEKAQEIAQELRKTWMVAYDYVASIGRRYRRQDEIGTPYCVTVDFETMEDRAVTVRDRDTMKQERVAIGELSGFLSDAFSK